MKKILLYSAIPLILASCFSMKSTSFQVAVLQADIPAFTDVNQIKVLNRTRVEANKMGEILKTGSLTYEYPEGINEAINGFAKEIKRLKFYDYKNLSVNKIKRQEGTGFPDSLSFYEINEQYEGDFLLASLEIFESNHSINYTRSTKMQMDTNGNEYLIDIVIGEQTISMTSGWRLYHSITAEVVDQVLISENITYTVEGVNRANASLKINERSSEYYKNLGEIIGTKYAQRISPTKNFVRRNYYSKSKSCSAIKSAVTFVKSNDWNAAKSIWEDALLLTQKPEDYAKLNYNLGVYYERIGNLDKAIKHVETAYNQDSSVVKDYLTDLKNAKNFGYPITN